MWSWILVPAALATGLAEPAEYALVDEHCVPYDLQAAWPVERSMRVTGHQETWTSPPGGPVAHVALQSRWHEIGALVAPEKAQGLTA